MSLLALSEISKSYPASAAGAELSILSGVNLELNSGESIAIIGPSGSGKSTLLNIIGTLDRPTGGKILLEGRDLTQLNDLELAEVRNSRIGFVFQSHHLLPHDVNVHE